MIPTHPRMKTWMELGGVFFDAAGAAARQTRHALRPRRKASYATRRPGVESPLWNLFVAELRTELAPLGSKVRLARFLGIPKQRLHDFLKGRSRLPDAELTLRLLHWLSEKRAGRDPAL